MVEKAKAKKAKALSKKTSVKTKKRDVDLEQPEDLELQAEEAPKKAVRIKATAPTAKVTPALPQAVRKVDADLEPQDEELAMKPPVATAEIIAPIQPRIVVNKPETPRQEPSRSESIRSEPARHEAKRPDPDQDGLRLRLSQSLTKKLKEQAADEGISLEEFVGELLAESVVLRAWEIVERKNAMKGQPQQGQGSNQRPHNNNNNNSSSNQGSGNRGGQRGNNQGNKGHRGMSHVRYQTIMDDKATFLEYVRSQEKPRR